MNIVENEKLKREVAQLRSADNAQRLQIGQLQSQLVHINTDTFQFNGLNKNLQDKLRLKAAENRMNSLYKFKGEFKGETGIIALKFRIQIMSYVTKLQMRLQALMDVGQALDNIRDAFKDKAAVQVSKMEPQTAATIIQFLVWFDKTYDLSSLRQELFDKLKNWVMPRSTPNLTIVETYQAEVELFDAAVAVTTQDVLRNTVLSEAEKITAVLNAIKVSKPKLWEPIRIKTITTAKAPQTLIELKAIIKHAHDANATLDATSKSEYKDPTSIGNVNAISMNNYPDLQNENRKYNFQRTNNSNSNNNNNRYNNNNTRFRPNTGSFRNSQNRQNRNNRNINYNKLGLGPVKQNKSRFEAPIYLAGYCNIPNCREWGHYASDCERIHQGKFIDLNRLYMSWRKPGAPPTQLSRKINITQTQDEQNDKDAQFELPSNEIENTTESKDDINTDNNGLLSPFNNEDIYD